MIPEVLHRRYPFRSVLVPDFKGFLPPRNMYTCMILPPLRDDACMIAVLYVAYSCSTLQS